MRALVARFAVFSLGILRLVEGSIEFQLMSATAQIYCDRIGRKIKVVKANGGGWMLVEDSMAGLLFWCDKGECDIDVTGRKVDDFVVIANSNR